MAELTIKTLGEICDDAGGIIRTGPFGSQLHQSDYREVGLPVVMPKNIIDGKVDASNIARIGPEDEKRLREHKLKKGDIVYARRGDIGRRALIRERENGWLCGTGSLRISLGNKIIDPDFLYYYLGDSSVIAWIQKQAIGATMSNLNTTIVRRIPIRYPSLSTQRKIATILSAYDDSIENNTRRIQILEEMAQGIYREWFVAFKFPGHEEVPLVDSGTELGRIPEGWEVNRLAGVLDTLESGSRPKGGIRPGDSDIPSIGAENILGLGKYDFSKEKFISFEFFKNMKKGVIRDQDVLLYKDGAQIGRKSMFRDRFPHGKCCVNEHVFILRCNGRCTQSYLYFWLDQPEMTQAIINLNANAAQPGISQPKVKSLPILLADKVTLDSFEAIVEPLLALLFNLAKKNNLLRTTRDLLLPRLVSGEVDVSELEIQ